MKSLPVNVAEKLYLFFIYDQPTNLDLLYLR